jgi:hypothetical protein
VAVAAARAAERPQFLLWLPGLPAAALVLRLVAAVWRAFLAQHRSPVMRAGRLTATMAALAVAVAAQLCRLLQAALRAAQAGLAEAAVAAVAGAAIRALAARAASAVMATAS